MLVQIKWGSKDIMNEVWICLKVIYPFWCKWYWLEKICWAWGMHAFEVCGLYNSEADAVKRCLDYKHFVGPLKMDESLPDEQVIWPGGYYPKGAGVHLKLVAENGDRQ